MSNENVFFEDEYGKILSNEEVNDLFPWEIEERKLHVYENAHNMV